MAGETYGSVGAAFGRGVEDFLLKQQALEHQKLLDSMAQQREARFMQNDALDADLRRQELAARTQEMSERQNDRKLQTHLKKREALIPGDVPSPELVQEAKTLGVPLRLGEAPTKPNPAPPALQAVDEPPMADVPMSPDANRPYEGTREDIARKRLADVITGDPDPNTVTAEALRLGIDPKEITSVLTANKGPKSKITPEIGLVAKGPDGKVVPGMVAMHEDGSMLLNGQPLPTGFTVERAPAPRDPLLDQLTRAQIANLQRQGAAAAGTGAPRKLTPAEERLAADMASGDLPYSEVVKFFSARGEDREKARDVYNRARELNPGLDVTAQMTDLRALGGTLNKLQQQYGAVEAYTKAANLNAQNLNAVLDKIPDTGFSGKPNEFARWLAKTGGSEDVAAFNGLMTSLQSEYSRIISNPNLTGVVTDSTRREFQDILDKGGTKGQIRRLLATLKTESENRRKGLEETMKEMRTGIQNSAGTAPATGGSGTRVYYDAQGNRIQR